MASIANDALPVFALFASTSTPAAFARAQLLAVAAILTTGRRTVSNLLRTLGHLTVGVPSSYHRVLSEAHWSGLRLAALLTRFLLRCYVVASLYEQLPAETQAEVGVEWEGKTAVTFSDAIAGRGGASGRFRCEQARIRSRCMATHTEQ